MNKFKYTLILLIFFIFTQKVEALDIQYGSLLDYKDSSVLIQYYGLGKKVNYICSISNYSCTVTKKTSISKSNPPILKSSIKKELTDKKANHQVFSPSGKWLAYYIQAREPDNTRFYTIKNVKDNRNYSISNSISYWDLVNEQTKVFEFSPDEKSLVYLDDKDNLMSLYNVDLNSLKDTNFDGIKIKTSAYIINTFTFYDSQNIYYVGNTKENPYRWSLYNLNLKTGVDKVIETDVSSEDKIIKIKSSLIFNRLQEKGYGPEVYNVKTKKIGYFKIPNIVTKKDVKNEDFIKIGNSNSVIMTPLLFKPQKTYPLLIWLHGGPLRQTSFGYHPYHSYGIYDSMLRLLQKNNVIILKLDYRGSLGEGIAYAGQIKGSVGKGDVDDVMEAVKYAQQQYNISNVYLAGNSYGGYLSLRTLVEHPNTFTGIFSINGVTDWESLLVRMKTSIFNTDFYGLPNSNNRDLYDQASIISRISNLGNQRIEIIQGQSDRTIPPWQADLLYKDLKDKNKNVNFVPYKGEDHVFVDKKNIGDICVRLFDLIGVKDNNECTN